MVCLHGNFNHFTVVLQQSCSFSLWKRRNLYWKRSRLWKRRPLSFVWGGKHQEWGRLPWGPRWRASPFSSEIWEVWCPPLLLQKPFWFIAPSARRSFGFLGLGWGSDVCLVFSMRPHCPRVQCLPLRAPFLSKPAVMPFSFQCNGVENSNVFGDWWVSGNALLCWTYLDYVPFSWLNFFLPLGYTESFSQVFRDLDVEVLVLPQSWLCDQRQVPLPNEFGVLLRQSGLNWVHGANSGLEPWTVCH